jgi:hypothetical protein
MRAGVGPGMGPVWVRCGSGMGPAWVRCGSGVNLSASRVLGANSPLLTPARRAATAVVIDDPLLG